MINQVFRIRPQIVNVNSDDPVFYPLSIRRSKFSGSCNNINDPYAKLCVPDVVKILNVTAFNLMSRNNKTRHIKRVNANVDLMQTFVMMINVGVNVKN